jgi:hypothetical protein
VVTLGIRPGDRAFRIVRIDAENRQRLDGAQLEGLVDLRLASKAGWPDTVGNLVEIARWGHFTIAATDAATRKLASAPCHSSQLLDRVPILK